MMKFQSYDEARFRANVNQALQQVQSILDTTRHPQLVDTTTDHVYSDKFVLAETITNTTVATLRTALTKLGVTEDQWTQWMEWVENKKTVTLRFQASDGCSLLKENVVEVEDPTTATEKKTTTSTAVSSSSWMGSVSGSSSSSSTTKVTLFPPLPRMIRNMP
eukprot:scaffold1769_cov185-Amphora_coffeaeformis.AAC.5